MKVLDTRSGEVLSALLSIVLGLSMLIAPDTAAVLQIMRDAMPEWALVNITAAVVCLVACFLAPDNRLVTTARFLSGCLWGTFILIFASEGHWRMPLFGIALVMFAFDIYLVMVKGQSWVAKVKSSTTGG